VDANEPASGRRQGTRRCAQRQGLAEQFAADATGQGRRPRSRFHPGPGVRHRALAATPVGAGGKLLQKPFKAADADVEALLLVGLYQLLYTRVPAHAAIGETVGCADKLKKPWAKALLNAVLRRAQREAKRCWRSWSATRWCAPPIRAGCKNP
jgi:hypothetical protein